MVMEPAQHRIPEHLATAVFTRAARLHLQSQGQLESYSLAELVEAGQAAHIPAEYIYQALHELHQPQPGWVQQTLRRIAPLLPHCRWQPIAVAIAVVSLSGGAWHFLSRPARLEPSRPPLEQLVQTRHCQKCAFNGADLRGKNLSHFDLEGANLRGADLTGANLSQANLRGADLSGATLDLTNLTGANLSGANLSGANINQANLTTANLEGALLTGTQVKSANLTGANLIAARLQASNLEGSDLTYANLQTADLEQVNMSGTILKNTDFRQAKNLETVNFSGAKL